MFELFKNTLQGVRGNTTVCKPVGMRKLSGLGRNLEPQKIVKFSIHNVTVSCVDRGCYKPPSHLYSAMSFGIDSGPPPAPIAYPFSIGCHTVCFLESGIRYVPFSSLGGVTYLPFQVLFRNRCRRSCVH